MDRVNEGKSLRGRCGSPHKAGGFTMVELMITVAILAILVALAVPSFTSMINSSRLAAQANELVASLQLARGEAVRRNARVTVCRSTDGTNCIVGTGQGSWLTFADANGNGTAQPGEVLRLSIIKAPVTVRNTVARVTFRPDGRARAVGGALENTTFTVCIPTTRPVDNQRLVEFGGGSRISTRQFNGAGVCP